MAVLLEEAVAQLRELIEAGATRIAIQAPPGSGKTTVLDALAVALAGSRRVVRIALPEADDAALVALVDAAIQLGFASPDLLDRVVPRHEPARVSWSEKLAAVREALACTGSDVLVLVDDPRFQAASGPESELFTRRAVEVTETLLRASAGTIVLAGSRIPDGVAEHASFRLPLVLDPVQAQADDATGRLDGGPLRALSPVVQQVLRALRAAGVDVGHARPPQLRLDSLVERELGRVFHEDVELRRTVARLAVLRVPFAPELLERAGLASLGERSRNVAALLLHTLDDGACTVPAALAREIRALLSDDLAAEAHRFAAVYHRDRHERARQREDVAAAIREELEEIYHLTRIGDAAALLARSLQFVEQYDALGKSLSQKALGAPREQEESLRRDAVRAYERAIEHDRKDAYAHHYIGYNLDLLGSEPERVEREYVAARDLDPGHPWHHGRYIGFLVTRAWMDEAREAWERALGDLADTGGPLQPAIYEDLHAQIARLLLARSELDFAADVLEDVPGEVRAMPWWRALYQLQVCLEEDRDERLVFPPAVSLDDRWDGPHLVAAVQDLDKVQRWRPGRVMGRDARGVLLRVAQRLAHAAEPTLSTLHVDLRALREEWHAQPAWLAVGTFVELNEYPDGTKMLKTWDRRSSSFDAIPYLPKLFPAPDRYIRRAFA
ncbi:ATP-binding protein [Sorangium cellulosum]|nr:ATP-binding protein [Sorangium cellulosum]